MFSFSPSTRRTLQLAALSLCICLSPHNATANPPANPAAVLDFDGDGKTDYVVVRRQTINAQLKRVWYIRGSQRGDYAQQWGAFEMQTRARRL